MIAAAVMRELAACNGGPGLSAEALAERLALPRAIVRNELSRLVFKHRRITCDTEGRYRIGDPEALLGVPA